MLPILFYEKPGCVNNTKQKVKLHNYGFKVISMDILQTKFTQKELLSFFNDQQIKSCINKNAPAIKNGLIDLEKINDEELLERMIKEPILIKRPLISFGMKNFCGFDIQTILEIKKSA